MKLQVDVEQLRLRLSEAELAQLSEQGVFEQGVVCADGSTAQCRLSLQADSGTGRCEGNLMDLRLALPRDAFLAFTAERPRRDGFGFSCGPLMVTVEVDVRDSHRTRRAEATTAGN